MGYKYRKNCKMIILPDLITSLEPIIKAKSDKTLNNAGIVCGFGNFCLAKENNIFYDDSSRSTNQKYIGTNPRPIDVSFAKKMATELEKNEFAVLKDNLNSLSKDDKNDVTNYLKGIDKTEAERLNTKNFAEEFTKLLMKALKDRYTNKDTEEYSKAEKQTNKKNQTKKNKQRENIAKADNSIADFTNYRKIQLELHSKVDTILIKPVKIKDIYIQNSLIENNLELQREKYRNRHTYYYGMKKKPTYQLKTYNNLNIDDFISISNKLFIIGEEGIGKSLYVKNLFIDAICDENYLPFFVNLIDIKNKKLTDYTIIDILNKILNSIKLTESDLAKLAEKYKIVIFFDGFDELYTANRQFIDTFVGALELFNIQFASITCVITSRQDSSQIEFEKLNEYHMLRIQHFSNEQSIAFINKIISLIPNTKNIFATQKLTPQHLINKYPEFSSSPLFLTILLFLINDNGESKSIESKKKSDLYLTFFDKVYQNAYSKKVDKKFPEKKDLLFIISELAISILMNQNNSENTIYLTKEYLYELISSFKSIEKINAKQSDICRIVLEDLSFFTIKDGYYNFIHESFYQFFCAYFIKEYDPENVFYYTGMIAPFNEYTTKLIYDYIYEMKPSVLYDYLFVDFFKLIFGSKSNNPTYQEFLKTFHADLTITTGSVDIATIAQNSDFYSYLIFEVFKEKLLNCNYNLYSYEDSDLYDIIVSKADPKDKNIYIAPYYCQTTFHKKQFDDDDEGFDVSVVSVDEYDEETTDPTPCGYSVQISNLSELNKEKYPELYDFVYNNPDFDMKKEYNKMIEFLDEHKKNLSK